MEFLRVYSRVLGLLAPERRLAIGLAVANVALAGLHFLEPILFGRVIDVLTGSAARGPDATWREAVDLLVIWGVVGISGICANILIALHADRLAHRRRLAALARYFEHVLSLPLAFHGGTHSGRLLKIMLRGADQLFAVTLALLREHLETFVIMLVLLPVSLAVNWRLALLLIVLAIVFAVLALTVISRTQEIQGRVEDYHSVLAERAGDALGNVMLVQSFDRLRAEASQIGDVIKQVLTVQYPVLTMWAIVTVLSRASATIVVIAIFVLGTWLHMRGQATVGEIVTFMGLATQLIGRMEGAMGFLSSLIIQVPGLNDFFSVLDAESTIREKPDAVDLGRVRGEVAFDHVTLSYDGVRPAVHDLTFHAPAGAMVALVGHTGSGKSTSMALLHRVWDPQAGAIRIDGVDIRDATLDSLRRNIGVVFQDTTMFYRTIAENLLIAKPDATEEELVRAARLAQAHDFILAHPQGYQTLVGERGITLSGGERQRLAIARAILKDPPILILDEATSALDATTEARVQQALKTLMRGRTTFIIAHRLSTVRNADLILVLDHGRLVEHGSFDDLIAANGAFAKLVSTQLGVAREPPEAAIES